MEWYQVGCGLCGQPGGHQSQRKGKQAIKEAFFNWMWAMWAVDSQGVITVKGKVAVERKLSSEARDGQ